MAYNPNGNSYRTAQAGYADSSTAVLDQGLRAYMLRVYNWMASGLVSPAWWPTPSRIRAR